MFLKGLREGGVPIKFSSWHTYVFSTGGASSANLLIQERSRSVKAIFTIQRRSPADLMHDSGTMHFETSQIAPSAAAASTLVSYQYRIGGRYFPASPVQCGVLSSNSAAEAYIELAKALNMVGDYRLSTATNSMRWGVPSTGSTLSGRVPAESDYVFTSCGTGVAQGVPLSSITQQYNPVFQTGYCGNMGSQCFAMATSLETSNGVEISGLNAEEQSDISLIAVYTAAQQPSFAFESYVYYDAMIVLRENNVLELIQ